MNVVTDKDERTWGMLCHLAALSGYFSVIGWIVGPLVVWLVKKDQYPFVDDQGKESLNFQISVMIYAIVCVILMLVLIGFLLLPLLGVFHVVMVIIASVKANDGETFRYPLTMRFIR
jgi:uncharacterized protein